MPSGYVPIDCNVYDELTLRVLRRTPVGLRLAHEDGGEETIRDVLTDVFTRGDEEFVRLGSGREVRLDRLIEVDGVKIRGAGCIR